jgi:hypothetical protein
MFIKTVRDLKEIVNKVPEKDLNCALVGYVVDDGWCTREKYTWVDKEIFIGGEWKYQIVLLRDDEAKENFDKSCEWDYIYEEDI